jgi:hypothetical protein
MTKLKRNIRIYVLIVLASLSFYNPLGLVSPQVGKFAFYLVCLIALWHANKHGVSLKRVKFPWTAYKMLFGGIAFSIVMAVLFQEQSLKTTIIATLPYLFAYSTFYVFMKLNIPKERIERIIWIFCYVSMGVYIVNALSFPNMVFGAEKEEFDMSRGIARLGVRSIELMVLFFLYAINQWMLTKARKYVWLILLTFTFIVLSLTRQIIGLSAVLGLLFIMQKASWAKKIGVIAVCALLYIFVIPQIPVFKAMAELSERQAESNSKDQEDIRIRAWRFYTYENQTNAITPFFGNGIPSFGKSRWGNEIEATVSPLYGGNGCFTVDVGWAGFFWYFGAIATLGLLVLLVKAAMKKKEKDRQYLTYWCVFLTLTAAASGPILFYNQIVSIMTVLYLIYGKEQNSNNNPQLQQQ